MQPTNGKEATDIPRDASMADPAPEALPNDSEAKARPASEEKSADRDENMAESGAVANESATNANVANGASVNGTVANGTTSDEKMVDEEKPPRSKKKARLHWDEENLTLNALEMERTPRMKIDEPKTPYVHAAGSEAGSSTSGSAPHSPGSPAVAFIPQERLQGFQSLEDGMEGTGGRANGGSGSTRSVQIVEDNARSSGSSPRSSSDFAAKRKRHYHNEARLSNFASSDGSRSPRASLSAEVQNANVESTVNGTAESGTNGSAAKETMGNGM